MTPLSLEARVYFDPDKPKEQLFLGDSLVMRQYKGLYFVSYSEKLPVPVWSVVILRSTRNGDIETLLMPTTEKGFKNLVAAVHDVVPIDSSFTHGADVYQIDPTPKQLMKLYKRGLFSERKLWRRINAK